MSRSILIISAEVVKYYTTKMKLDSFVYTDSYQKSYNALDVSEFKHFRVSHSNEFTRGGSHINGIKNF